MRELWKVLVGGAIAVLVFDAIASVASIQFGFAYATASVGTWTIYAFVGLYAGARRDVRAAMLAGAAMGGVDATLGWALARTIGAGRVPAGPADWLATVITVTLIGAAIGGLAGLAARLPGASGAPQGRH